LTKKSIKGGHERSPEKCEACAKKTLVLGLAANIFLAAFKLFVGFLGRSRALIGSGLCNLSDVTSAVVVVVGVKYSNKPADEKYPYGYGKVEFVAQFVMGIFMIAGTIALIMSSFIVLAKKAIVIPHLVVFFTAILSAIINGILYKYTHCGGKELNSPALKAHAEHNKIDVISSLLVALSVIVARHGLEWVDPVIAIFECIHVIHGSFIILMDGVNGIMDTSLPDKYVDEVKDRVLEIDGVKKVANIRARQAGRQVVLDLNMVIDPEISVLAAKMIKQKVKSHLRQGDRHIGNVMIQVVPAE
jgi:cation diffusion facilitator family transporter